MIGHATAQRRANAFAQALEAAGARTQDGRPEGSTQERPGDREARQERLVGLAEALGALPRPTLDPGVRTVQRAQLIAAMEAALAEGEQASAARVPSPRGGAHRASGGPRRFRPRGRWSRRLAIGGLTVGVAAGAFSGVAAASTDALPGDTLYGLKRGMEDVRLGLAGDDADRGKLLLDMATTRLQEARRLMERRRGGPLDTGSLAEMRGTLLGMHTEVSEGHRLLSGLYRQDGSLAPIEELNAFSQQQRLRWAQLRARLPQQLNGVGNQVSSVFDAIERDVAPLRGLLPPASPGGTPGARPGGHLPGTAQPQGGGSPSAARSSTAGHDGNGARRDSSPSASTTTGQGLLGGPGLLAPQATGTPSATSPRPGATAGDTPAGEGHGPAGVTLPPLLPGLLPGIGISGEADGT